MKIFIVDAFTDKPFKGNPAGVCLLEKEIDEALMQSIAAELNLSETAFILASDQGETEYAIRYFTPTVEVAFCGHATLASAKLVLHYMQREKVNFTTAHDLKISATCDGEDITMLFPLYNAFEYAPSPKLFAAFGIGKPIAAKYAEELEMLIIEVESKEVLLSIKPDFSKALQVPDIIKEVVVTTKSADEEYDFYSRCFCPWIGINEDPVTGAAYSVLAKYWGDILGKNEMKAWQASRRGGYLHLKVISENTLEVKSKAVIVFSGELHNGEFI
jgi:PhzF family phenazine biosynthesis protein